MCSRDVKIAGLLGSAASLEAKSSAVAEQQVGLGGTTKWRLASLVSHATITHSFTAVDGRLVAYAMDRSSHHRLVLSHLATATSTLSTHSGPTRIHTVCVLRYGKTHVN